MSIHQSNAVLVQGDIGGIVLSESNIYQCHCFVLKLWSV